MYDAKRRARRREQGQELSFEERRAKREQPRETGGQSSEHLLETIVLAMQGLTASLNQREAPASGALAEVQETVRQRLCL